MASVFALSERPVAFFKRKGTGPLATPRNRGVISAKHCSLRGGLNVSCVTNARSVGGLILHRDYLHIEPGVQNPAFKHILGSIAGKKEEAVGDLRSAAAEVQYYKSAKHAAEGYYELKRKNQLDKT